MKNTFLKTFTIALMVIAMNVSAANKVSTGSGSFTASGTWSPSGVPVAGDMVTILAGHNVTIPGGTTTISGSGQVAITVNGTITFGNTSRLALPATSGVVVSLGGRLNYTGAGNGTNALISVGGTNVWTAGNGSINTPTSLPNNFFIPLPVLLSSFELSQTEGSIKIKWSTAQELNNNYFSVQRSLNGVDFTEVAKVEGNATTSVVSNYEYVDNTPAFGFVYYRLVQVDFDGNEEVLEAKGIIAGKLQISFWPNPATDVVNVSFESTIATGVEVVITDVMGKEVKRYAYQAEEGVNKLTYDISDLTANAYFFKISDVMGNVIASKTFLK